MNVVVLLKQTLDTEEKIQLVDGAVAEQGVKFIINPYDEYALEEALRIREAHGGSVTVVTCGPERAAEALRTALAMGADDAVLLADAGLPDDGHAIAAALTAVIDQLQPDLVLAGLFTIDRGAGSIALQVAERLGLPHAAAVVKVEIRSGGAAGVDHTSSGGTSSGSASSGSASSESTSSSLIASIGRSAKWASSAHGNIVIVERDTEWGIETIEIPLPALLTAQQGLNEPRYPSLPGIMKAKRKPLRQLTVAELNLPANELAPRTERLALLAPSTRAAGKKLTGTPSEQAAALVELLQNEAKLF
ncbi:electron transfer flavoprotein subunit beta [Paenibacillus baekrokdamisoli]|uniref:Electron transfer flavoprotein subunit beta n=1 Tax=Paenibacillus baekrokdamisoli TaxID=1712516 RepID=A0A3G9JID6_9BACL|nr:electron transfer flavoprotein subunit beta/FixA family protein [Paenibacillus baekrokdamisoli]MBB3068213.1 electron transfer flavoprotein beta subunit [Paenibacillus baekrokdamisoli]BBH22744.1 electron transfer flavoprotein subunit beta [Paenibacillus baekrokdamisoli]